MAPFSRLVFSALAVVVACALSTSGAEHPIHKEPAHLEYGLKAGNEGTATLETKTSLLETLKAKGIAKYVKPIGGAVLLAVLILFIIKASRKVLEEPCVTELDEADEMTLAKVASDLVFQSKSNFTVQNKNFSIAGAFEEGKKTKIGHSARGVKEYKEKIEKTLAWTFEELEKKSTTESHIFDMKFGQLGEIRLTIRRRKLPA